MTTRTLFPFGIALTLVSLGCGGSDPMLIDVDAGADAGPTPDPDGGPTPDAGPAPDAGPLPDAGPPPPACGDTTPVIPADPTDGAWSTSFNLPGVGGTAPADALALAVGPSDEIYVGGMFSHAGSTPANNVVRWTPTGWAPLGEGIDGDVMALAVHPSGSPLYAAAQMHDLWETEILSFDGSTWTSLTTAGGLGRVEDMQVGTDGTLYVAGLFEGIGGDDTLQNFALWDGVTWSDLGGSPDSSVSHVLVDSTGLCVGGMFASIGTTAAQNVACWNGTGWIAHDIPAVYYEVKVLARDSDGALLAGGHFTLDDSDYSQGGSLARWTGSSWEYVGGGVHSFLGAPGYVEGIAVVGTDIYVGGYFNFVGPSAGETRISDVARWNGTEWVDLGGVHRDMGIGIIEQNVRRVVADSAGDVYFAGMFTVAGEKNASHVAMFDGTYWNTMTTVGQLDGGVNGVVNALAARGTCGVYVGGGFRYAGDIVAHNVALIDDSGWHALGGGLVGYVTTMAVGIDGALYVGGEFSGPGFYHLGRWDGTAWSGIGNTMGPVHSLLVDEAGNLYVGGEFEVAGDVRANHIAMWDGTAWHALGDGLDGRARGLAIDADGDLVVVGQFENAGGAPAANVARWDGSAWHAYGDGLPGWQGLQTVTTHMDQLLVGGGFDTLADGAKGIATWNGTEWVGFHGGLQTQYGWSQPYVNGLVSVGDVLFAVGMFTLTEGGENVNAAYWNGTEWSPMGAGFNDIAEAAIGTNAGVWVGGTFTKADATPSVAIAHWRYAE